MIDPTSDDVFSSRFRRATPVFLQPELTEDGLLTRGCGVLYFPTYKALTLEPIQRPSRLDTAVGAVKVQKLSKLTTKV